MTKEGLSLELELELICVFFSFLCLRYRAHSIASIAVQSFKFVPKGRILTLSLNSFVFTFFEDSRYQPLNK